MQDLQENIKLDAPVKLTDGAVKQLNKIMESEKLSGEHGLRVCSLGSYLVRPFFTSG